MISEIIGHGLKSIFFAESYVHLYVIPRFSTAYIDPFAEIPTLGLLCTYFTKDGLPLETSPEYTLKKAHQAFQQKTGFRFEAMGELEFYVIDNDDRMFQHRFKRGKSAGRKP